MPQWTFHLPSYHREYSQFQAFNEENRPAAIAKENVDRIRPVSAQNAHPPITPSRRLSFPS